MSDFQVLKLGGSLLLRDYGLYDHAMLRFSKGHKLAEQFYVRQDGTRAYYFSLGNVQPIITQMRNATNLFQSNGLSNKI